VRLIMREFLAFARPGVNANFAGFYGTGRSFAECGQPDWNRGC